jgi:rubrerythrin
MSINYKTKKKAKKISDTRITLVAQHRKKVNEINKLENSVPSLTRELKKYQKEYDSLLKSSDGFGFIETGKGKKMYVLNNKIRDLNEIIKNIKCNKIKDDYYSKTAHILYKYYDNIQAVSQRHHDENGSDVNNEVNNDVNNDSELCNVVENKLTTVKEKNKKMLCDDDYAEEYEYNNEKKTTNIIDLLKKNNNKKSYSSTKISDFLDMEEKSNRADLLDSYTKIIHPTKYQPNRKSKKIEIDICKLCDVEMNLIQSEGLVVCPQCGREEHILIDSDKPSYKDPPPEAGEFTYKRINRFDEWLTQYQAKETTEIPQEVLDSILLEMKKEGITNLCRLTMEKVRGYLKKLSLNKYYEHIPHIIYCLNGLPTPRLTQETEEKLRSMFRQIQDIFDIVCPDDRTNFLSYSYLLRKLLELLGEDEHMKYFRLHKSREKIYQHDKVWEKICKLLLWDYIRTV